MKGVVWYYKDKEAAINKLLQIKDSYNKIGIEIIKSSQSSNNYSFTFDNGDYWRIIYAGDSSRGYRMNISYISKDISNDIIISMIKHCTTAYPYTAYHFY